MVATVTFDLQRHRPHACNPPVRSRTIYALRRPRTRCPAETRRAAAIALESCAMATIHQQIFAAVIKKHQAEDTALQMFLGHLLKGQYSVYGTSPDLQVQVCNSCPPEAQPSAAVPFLLYTSNQPVFELQGREPAVAHRTVHAAVQPESTCANAWQPNLIVLSSAWTRAKRCMIHRWNAQCIIGHGLTLNTPTLCCKGLAFPCLHSSYKLPELKLHTLLVALHVLQCCICSALLPVSLCSCTHAVHAVIDIDS